MYCGLFLRAEWGGFLRWEAARPARSAAPGAAPARKATDARLAGVVLRYDEPLEAQVERHREVFGQSLHHELEHRPNETASGLEPFRFRGEMPACKLAGQFRT